MIIRCISGFQSGVDIGAIRAAASVGLPTGGWMTRGFLTENGPRPEYAELYGAQEHESPDYPPRTEANVRASDVTIWFGPGDSAGYWCTRKAAERLNKPFWEVGKDQASIATPKDLAAFLRRDEEIIRAINCAGSRESKKPGVERRTFEFLVRTFRALETAAVGRCSNMED